MEYSAARSRTPSPSVSAFPAQSLGATPTAFTGEQAERIRARVQDAVGDRFHIAEVIGRGGMGVVFRAYEPALDREVALKVLAIDPILAPAAYAHFEREAKLAAQLDHPNIVPIYAIGQSASVAYFTMRFVRGGTLDEHLAHHGALDYHRAIAILRDIAAALDYAHDHGIIHRDVKPANVLLGDAGHAMVSDFGIARAASGAGGVEGTISPATGILGSPGYMAPEQWRGENVVARTDQYALGVMAFQMLTGRRPFDSTNTQELMRLHVMSPVPRAGALRPGVTLQADAALRRAMAKIAELRFPRATAFVDALSGQRPVTVTFTALPPVPTVATAKGSVGIVVALIAAAAFGIAISLFTMRSPAAPAASPSDFGIPAASPIRGGMPLRHPPNAEIVRPASPIAGAATSAPAPVEPTVPAAPPPSPSPSPSPLPPASSVAADTALLPSPRTLAASGPTLAPEAPAFIRVIVRGGVSQVRIDGQTYGFSPAVIKVEPGTHVVTVEGAGDAFLPSQHLVQARAKDTTSALFAARIQHEPGAPDSTAGAPDTALP